MAEITIAGVMRAGAYSPNHIGNDTAITVGGMNGHFELNVYKPLIIKNFLESANLMAEACVSLTDNCVSGIRINEAKVSEYMKM